jgi:hypothetical protein
MLIYSALSITEWKSFMQKLTKLALITLLSSSLITVSQASCERHIYNESNSEWTFSFITPQGEVRVLDAQCAGHTCFIPPKKTMTINYNFSNNFKGYVYIGDKNQNFNGFGFTKEFFGKCVSIHHEGSTGSVSMNEPSGGDFTIEKDTW